MWFRNIFKDKPAAPAAGAVGSRAATISLSGPAVRALDRLQLNTGPLIPSAAGGMRSSAARRPAYEFREHRPYAPGDDVRYVDWKASARQEHIFIKQGEQQKGAAVYLLVDTSASMGWGAPPKSTTALALAHALGYLALAQNDRLVILPVEDESTPSGLHPLGPLWGKGQAPALESYLKAVKFRGQIGMARTLAGLPRRDLSKGGLIFVISDLFGSVPTGIDRADSLTAPGSLFSSLASLPAPTWQVVLCHILHPAELEPRLNGPLEMLDVENGHRKRYTIDAKALETYRRRLQEWQEALARQSKESRVVYCMLPSNASMEDEIIPTLRRARIVIPRR